MKKKKYLFCMKTVVCGNADCRAIFITHSNNHKHCSAKCRNKVKRDKYYNSNRDKILSQRRPGRRKFYQKQILELTDLYIKRRLCLVGIKNPSKQDIELKRMQIKLKRKLNEKLRDFIASGNNDSIIRLLPSTY